MKILIELPTWLGDAVMATPAIEAILSHYPDAKVSIVGSFVSTEMMAAHPRITNIYHDRSREGRFRLYHLYQLAKEIKRHDIALSFRSHLFSKALLYFTKSPQRFYYDKRGKVGHQVEKYFHFVKEALGVEGMPKQLAIYHDSITYKRPTLGINPGATYGSAKRWYPEEFAKVAIAMSQSHDIVIFGGPSEGDIAEDIVSILQKEGIVNYQNLAGETTISELISHIGGLSLFVTNDSGPMHIAAAYQVPTVAIFGPTKFKETSQWMHEKGVIVRKVLDCSPCMKRTCPIKTHACMKEIKAQEVIDALRVLI
jgi:heptosyltransferase-2